MEPSAVFASKAEKYAKYRWRYAPEAIQTIFDQTGITSDSWVADIGAGTGLLTREFAGKVRRIYAVEPNPEMRAIAARELGCFPACRVIYGRAEATTLKSHSMDLVCAAQAVHWFDPEASRVEFYRILSPGGWIAICRNYGTNREIGKAIQGIYPAECDTDRLMIGKSRPGSYYFRDHDYLKFDFPFESQLSWEDFMGSLSTASYAPDEGSVFFTRFERKARHIFDDFSVDGEFLVQGATELYLGQIS